VAGRRRWLVISAWLVLAVALAPLLPALQREAADESDTFSIRGSESARAERIIETRFSGGGDLAAVVAYVRDGGLTAQDRERIREDGQAFCEGDDIPALARVVTVNGLACGETNRADVGPALITSEDGSVALTAVVMSDDSTPTAEAAVAAIRETVPRPGDPGLRAYVTGEAGFEADRSAALEGIDETLLGVTVLALALLLLAIYRSPLVALVPLAVVAVAYVVAAGLTYALVAAGATTVSGQTTAILIVLMFGAGTDYCLLLVARAREEGDVPSGAARTAPAVVSAGAIVVAAMLVLALADSNATREMGPILALGVAVMVAAGLTLLPATLAVLHRRLPPAAGPSRTWTRVGAALARRPAPLAVAVTLVLGLGALGLAQSREPLGFADGFRDPPESVAGQDVIAERFLPGRVAPLQVVTTAASAETVIAALTSGPGTPVQEMYAATRSSDGRLVISEAYLRSDPFSEEAADAVPGIRAAARRAARGTPVLVGGAPAEAHDTSEALAADTRLIAPLALGLILLVLVVLLRALVLPLVVVATVILSFAFALGASSLVFTHLLDQPASDPTLTLFAFVFLVALGVDYNVFLLARIREERRPGRAAEAVTAALARTGGVITSAGLVLAVTFGVLMALPLEALFQVGFVVALGLLADTFLVRALLVPALAILLGDRGWWPGRPPLAETDTHVVTAR